MLVDGRAIAGELLQALKNELSHHHGQPHLTVVMCAPALATQKYVALKRRLAMEAGIAVNVIELPTTTTTEECVEVVTRAQLQTDGVIVQLPVPPQIDVDAVVAAIAPACDVDGMHYAATGEGFVPPVVGAIAAIAKQHDILLTGQRVVIVGNGRLVGEPAAVWARNQGADVTVLTVHTKDNATAIATADVLILGAGVPHLVQPDMVKPGVVIFDAGTSEAGGQLQGDADPACAEVASLLTPVPRGIGPVTVAVLLRNVLAAAQPRAK